MRKKTAPVTHPCPHGAAARMDRPIDCGDYGSVLLVTLVILLLVTSLGLSSISTTDMELKVAGNERLYRRNYYRAESVIKEAALLLEQAEDTAPVTTPLKWLSGGETIGGFKPESGAWVTSGGSINASESTFYDDGDAQFCALRRGSAPGSNLDMSAGQKWEYVVYGRSSLASGSVQIAAGYLKKSE